MSQIKQVIDFTVKAPFSDRLRHVQIPVKLTHSMRRDIQSAMAKLFRDYQRFEIVDAEPKVCFGTACWVNRRALPNALALAR